MAVACVIARSRPGRRAESAQGRTRPIRDGYVQSVPLELLIQSSVPKVSTPHLPHPVYRIQYPNRWFSQTSPNLLDKTVVRGQQNIDRGLFGAGKVQRVKSSISKRFQGSCPFDRNSIGS